MAQISNSPTRTSSYRLVFQRAVMLSVFVGAGYLSIFPSVSLSWLLVADGEYLVAVLAVLTRLPEAIDVTRTECERTAAERDAFEQFLQRIATADPAMDQPPNSAPNQGSSAAGPVAVAVPDTTTEPESSSMETIRKAYRETVMAVPHYDEEYNESLEENVSVEFGPEIAQAVSGGELLSPQLRKALLEKSLQAKRERMEFLQSLEKEHRAVVEARRRLRDTNETITSIENSIRYRPVRELVDAWERLDVMEAKLEDFVADRQSQVRSYTGMEGSGFLQTYLYQSSSWSYPVLNDALDTVARIRDVKSDVIEALDNW